METNQGSDQDDVVGIQFLLFGSLVYLAIIFCLGLIVNIPAIVIYLRSRQIRGFTDKFILFVLLADLVSLFVFVPISVVFVVEYCATLTSSSGNGVALEDRPIFLDNAKVPHASEGGEGHGPEDQFSSLCVQQWTFIVHKFFFILTANLSILAALKIGVERYLAVVAPLHYHRILKSSVLFFASLASCVLSLSFAVLIAMEPSEFSAMMSACQCASNWIGQSLLASSQVHSVKLTDSSDFNEGGPVLNPLPQNDLSQESLNTGFSTLWPVLKLVHATVFLIVPVFVMVFMYTRIWIEARRQNARIAQHHSNKSPYILPADVSKPEDVNVDGLQLVFSKFKLVQRLKRRARMDRAARVAILTVSLVVVCFGPLSYDQISAAIYALLNSQTTAIKEGVQSRKHGLSALRCLLPTLLACLHPLLSPLVYVYRYKKVRSELKNLLKQMISSATCCSKDLTDCQTVVQQFNYLAQKLPVDVGQQMIESQLASSSTDSETLSVTIDLRCGANTSDNGILNGSELCYGANSHHHHHHQLSTELVDDRREEVIEYSDVDGDSQECRDQSTIAVQSHNNGIFRSVVGWMNSYSRRWYQHRESVTSTASFVTLLSTKSKSNSSTEI